VKIRFADGPRAGESIEDSDTPNPPPGTYVVLVELHGEEQYSAVYRPLGRDKDEVLILRACPPGPGVQPNWKYGYLPCGHRNNGQAGHEDPDDAEGPLEAGLQQIIRWLPDDMIRLVVERMVSNDTTMPMRGLHVGFSADYVNELIRLNYKTARLKGAIAGILVAAVLYTLVNFLIHILL
jgi:hypothetical protein